jgi:uncharacterized protein
MYVIQDRLQKERNMDNQKNNWAVVTGASAGIGKAFAENLAAKGKNLVLVARNRAKLSELSARLKSEYGIETRIICKDLSAAGAAGELFHEVESLKLQIDTLINNAGFAVYGRLHETDIRRNEQQLMLNVVNLSLLTQLFLPAMVERKSGAIINVASTAAFQPVPYMSNYGASKAFVDSFTEALWAEYRNSGVRFLSLCPGATETEFFDVVGAPEASVGKRDTPTNVVTKAFEALRRGRIYIIPGPVNNFLLSQLGRLFTRRFIARTAEKVMRPRRASAVS